MEGRLLQLTSEDIGEELEDIGEELEDIGEELEDIGEELEDIGEELEDIMLEQKGKRRTKRKERNDRKFIRVLKDNHLFQLPCLNDEINVTSRSTSIPLLSSEEFLSLSLLLSLSLSLTQFHTTFLFLFKQNPERLFLHHRLHSDFDSSDPSGQSSTPSHL